MHGDMGASVAALAWSWWDVDDSPVDAHGIVSGDDTLLFDAKDFIEFARRWSRLPSRSWVRCRNCEALVKVRKILTV